MLRLCPADRLVLVVVLLALATPGPADAVVPSGGECGDSCEPAVAASLPSAYNLLPGPEGTWAGVNEAHQVRVEISGEGVRIVPLAAGRPAWDWSLSLVAHGPPDGLRAARPGPPFAVDDRIELAQDRLTEWFVNGPEGVRHGLVLPPLEGPRLAYVEFALGGSLTPKVAEDGRAITFLDAGGRPVLIDREARAADAHGRDVTVRWQRLETPASPSGRLRLVVEGGGHADPVSVMGLLVTAKGEAAGAGAPVAGLPEIAPLAAPANDQCAGAEAIPGTGPFPYLSSVHDITDATMLDDPPLPSCQTNLSSSVWFSFTPAANGSYSLSLCADGPTGTTVDDTVLAIYEATGDCAGFTEVAGGCDDDSCGAGDLQSVIGHIDLAAGARYYVVAWKYGATAPPAGLSGIQLRVDQNPPPGPAPANDRCGGAEIVPASGPFPYLTSVTADISGATTTGDPPPPTCQPNVSRSIWYVFTPANAGRYTFSACADGPTGTTVDDTTMAVYEAAGACSGFTQLAGACDDDSCAGEAAQSVIRDVPLSAGTTYYLVVWQYGLAPPAAGNTAIQVRVSEELAPGNDTCSGAPGLALDTPVSGTTANAGNDYQLPAGSACFTGIGQTPSTASGGDVAYTFTVPRDGRYSFRVSGYEAVKNAVLYVSSDCPAGPAPASVSGCLGAANRNAGYPGEEVFCLAVAAGQTLEVFVDENAATAGSPFMLEVNECRQEAGSNDAPGSAGEPACGVEGSIGPAGDADFYAVGTPPAGSRLFALVDGAAANSTDFDLRVTTGVDTLEYDDLNNDTPFGNVSPNVAGTPLTGAQSFLKVSHYLTGAQSEPYRLYATIQPPPDAATREIEPNDSPAAATFGLNLYYTGALSGQADADIFSFTAAAGDLLYVGLDLDPLRDNTPFNATLALLGASGSTLATVNDGGSTSQTVPGNSSLSAATPASPGEGIVYRTPASGTHYARIGWSSGIPGDYLLSIARNCTVGTPPDADSDGVPDESDCAPGDPTTWAIPGEATGLIVAGEPDATSLQWSAPADPGGTAVVYDVLRSDTAMDFTTPACLARDLATISAADPDLPAAAFYYLVRSRNACGVNAGTRSDGTPRVTGDCP
jgi:hypothetical protein